MKKLAVFAVFATLMFIALPALAGTNSHLMFSAPMGVEVEIGKNSSDVSGALMLQADGNLFANQFAPKNDVGLHLELGLPLDMTRMPRVGLGSAFKFDRLLIQVAAVQQLYLKEAASMVGASIAPTIVFDECLGISYRATMGGIFPGNNTYVSHVIGISGYFPEKMFR